MKPEWNEVYRYAERRIKVLTARNFLHTPDFQKDEMAQEARIRVWQAYESLEGDKGWKSYISLHVRGAFLDYYRSGSGFIEDKTGSAFMSDRVTMFDHETRKEKDVEAILAVCGFYDEMELREVKIRWDLISHLASREDAVLILAKSIMGFSITEIAEDSSLSRERVHQQVSELIAKFDNPTYRTDKWINQIIYAFGLSDFYGTPNKDNGWGWEFSPIDLFNRVHISNKEFTPQLALF